MTNLPFTHLTYCEDELDSFIKANKHSLDERTLAILKSTRKLYWNLFLFSKDLDKFIDGRADKAVLLSSFNRLRSQCGITLEDDTSNTEV